MVKAFKIIIIILTIIMFSSCCELFNNGYHCVDIENLKGFGEYQDISKFRIDGYYYCLYPNYSGNYLQYRIFYHNGIIFSAGISVTNYSFHIIDSTIINTYKYRQFPWGSYQIEETKISRYFYNPVFMWRRNIYVVKGNILNDTTYIEQTFYEDVNTGETDLFSEKLNTFHFRKLEQKPDSTNFLIRNEYLQEQMKKGYEEYMKGKK